MSQKYFFFMRLALALLCLTLIPPQTAFAGLDGSQFHKSYNYQINLSGTSSVKLKFPCGGNSHNFSSKDKSVLYFKLPGQSEKTQLMELHSKQGTKDDASQKGKFMYFSFEFNWNCAYNHTLQLTSGASNAVTFTKDGGVDVAKATGANVYWIEMEFRVPQSWCGQHVEFEWNVWSSDNGSSRIPTDAVTVDIPDAPEGIDPELTQPMIMPNDIGKIGYMWYISAREVNNAYAQWKTSADAAAEQVQNLGKEMTGTVLLDATEPHYGFHVVADYTDTYGYSIIGRSSEKVDVPMLHAPINLKAIPANDGKGGVKVTWQTNYPGYSDISETDVFEVQRSLTGKEADFKTITSELYDEDKTDYEFYDEKYLSEVKSADQLLTTKYRVRRSSTALWGWEDNPTVATTALNSPMMALYVPTGTTASWADEASHTMQVKWDYLTSIVTPVPQRTYPTYTGNGTAEAPYSIASTEDWNQLADWIANNNAQYADKHYRLDADIDVGRMIGSTDGQHDFKGTFDGNGHTLFLGIEADGKENVAPFCQVNGATIKNLRIAGTVDAKTQQFASSLIGYSYGETNVTNCWSSATIKGNRYESGQRDATHGGFVAILKSGAITFNDCLFSGSIIDPSATNCGGFVGWVATGGNMAYFNNCLMAGTMTLYEYQSSSEYSAVFARCSYLMSTSYLKFNKCYRKEVPGITYSEGLKGTDASNMDDASLQAALGDGWENTGEVTPILTTSWRLPHYYFLPGSGTETDPYLIECEEDWDNLAEMIESEPAQYADKHYRLTNDIIVRQTISNSEETAFKGTFDGDGHIMYVCVEDTSSTDVVPFRMVIGGSVINLRTINVADADKLQFAGATGDVLYVWDDRATMTLRLKKYNRAGELVETIDYPVTAAEVAEKSKEITLNRSCLNSEVELIVRKAKSPLMAADSTIYAAQLPDDKFYFQVSGQVSKTVMTETRQSSVVLTWDIDGDVVDYFQVLRKEKGQPDTAYEVVADSLVTMAWEDTRVSPLATYIYKVQSAVDCEGLRYNTSDEVEGACKHTGMVEGYVRYPDGTGVAGMEINVTLSGGGQAYIGKTDDEGYFMVDGLPYNGQTAVSYDVTPVSSDQIRLDVPTMPIEFNSISNHVVLKAFVVQNAHSFSGYVMYDGTSIPVKGAGFLLNGRQVMKGGKPLTTDFEGKFAFYVPNGYNTIQAVMDGHSFTNKGYFKSSDGYDFQGDVEKIYFYDETKVKLVGRIVGGDTQGRLPLDNNLSRNNLGTGVKMVLTLEGDNTSWLVYDNLNPEKSINDYTVTHGGGTADHEFLTRVHTTRKRIEVSPDSLTGEYRLMLPPVRWKVQQIYSDGYATLFQEGMVNEVIDLTDCLTLKEETVAGRFATFTGDSIDNPVVTYNAQYSRIYHNPVELTYKQQTYGSFDYLGDQTYKYKQVDGTSLKIPLAEDDGNGNVKYTFGYPVYSIHLQYPTNLSAVERYYWNNDPGTGIVDVVKVGGGKVTVQNDMKLVNTREVVELDENGEGTVMITADELPYLLTDKDALRTVTMTLTQDGTTYEAQPIKAYVLNIFLTGSTKDVISTTKPTVLDVLRDPPGAYSYATLGRGTTLSTAYSMDMTLRYGTSFGIEMGKKLDNYVGAVNTLTNLEFGVINNTSNLELFDLDIIWRNKVSTELSYTVKLNQDISTSADPNMIGAPADLYIGTVNNMFVTSGSTIRAIPDSVFRQMSGKLGGTYSVAGLRLYGSMVEIAQGTAEDGKLYHLVRDESLVTGAKVASTFIYSQQHIFNTVIPELVEHSRNMMFIGTAEEAQAKADATGHLVYRSLVPAESPAFAVANIKDGEMVFNAYEPGKADDPGMSYVIHVPQTGNKDGLRDSVAGNWSIIQGWLEMIGINEMQKQTATQRAANYSLDGGGQVTYGEEFTSRLFTAMHSQNPLMIGNKSLDTGSIAVFDVLGGLAVPAAKALASFINLLSKSAEATEQLNAMGTEMKFSGFNFKFNFDPVFDFDLTDWGKEDKAFSRKETFTIKMNPMSHLDVDVMRVQPLTAMAVEAMMANSEGGDFDMSKIDFTDLSSSMLFFGITDMAKSALAKTNDISTLTYATSFVYRTRGGATAQPWEDERRALFYNTGTVLDERTKKIENPKIKLDRQSISGVNHDDPARFTVYLTNESEQPEAVTGPLEFYTLYLKDGTNPNGAKVYCDGYPLGAVNVRLLPGQVVQKVIEVRAGENFDYEGLTLGIKSQNFYQTNVVDEVSFDVHYLRTAGNVDIASPADKWIMNTDAEYDNERGYFIPVVISGFDKHQKNFDHIEFQYKETARGEDYWTNLCSYYADSTLMAKASGMKEKIPENGNITAHFYGEGVVMEKAYDLRAMLYCRNGDTFLTTASKVISGVKDTRRPQLFGTPEPVSGILGAGENIVFNFSEDIEYNYLSDITNFEVKGEVNNDNLTTDVSLQFSGTGSVESEATRNLSDKDITIDLIIRPDQTGKDMPLFSHGSDGKKLQLWITKDGNLKAVVNQDEYTSAEAIDTRSFQQVALVLHQPDADHANGYIEFFNGGHLMDSANLKDTYTGTGNVIFGATNERSSARTYYSGRMMEARLWYRALTGGLLGSSNYGFHRLTGYEMGLMDYWPMSEGTGNYVADKAQGAHMQIGSGIAWARPEGMSLRLTDADKGIALDASALARTAEQDYTLMFWFRNDKREGGTLISNGKGTSDDEGAANKFYVGFEGAELKYRSNGKEVSLPGTWADGDWHHYAMTMNRSMNVLNFYIDQTLRASIEPDGIGGIVGGMPMLGHGFVGNIDEVCMFDQALLLTLLQSYSTRSPQGDEAGLRTYLGFQRQERQGDNDIVTVPYVYSKKIYTDNGEIRYQLDPETKESTGIPVRDYLFVASADEILAHIDQTMGAPVTADQALHNLKSSFVGRDHSILMNILTSDDKINKRNIYVTMREIPDKNGNTLASPVTASFFVDRNPLRWKMKTIAVEQTYGEATTFEVGIQNNSQETHTYTVKNNPRWLTVSPSTNTIGATEEQTLSFTVSKDLNVGKYDEILYLIDEDGLAEPLMLSLEVIGEPPYWTEGVDRSLRQYSMNITARVVLNDEIASDPDDVVGVFDEKGLCHGVTNISYNEQTGESFAFITVYNDDVSGSELSFRLWNHSIGKEQVLIAYDADSQTETSIKFLSSRLVGSPAKPIILKGGDIYLQTIKLYEGWNWMSINVLPDYVKTYQSLLNRMPMTNGDLVTDNQSGAVYVYNSQKWISSGMTDDMTVNHKTTYFVKVQKDAEIQVYGSIIKNENDRTIPLVPGWNTIGFTPMLNLTVEAALADYNNKATEGDIIKSHDEYAVFTVTNGVGRWKGSLKYMKPGEGYMLRRNADTRITFVYPFYEPNSTFMDQIADNPVHYAPQRSTMSLTAMVQGVETQPGDRLISYSGAESRGQVSADEEGLFYLSVAGDQDVPLWFALERDGEIIATTSEIMNYSSNAVVGLPDKPTAIDFVKIDSMGEGWYTLGGIKLIGKPAKSGVYIHDGKKEVIK
jgi:hypothetical protein